MTALLVGVLCYEAINDNLPKHSKGTMCLCVNNFLSPVTEEANKN